MRWGETTAPPWSSPERNWRWQRHPACEFLFFGNAALIAPLIDARAKLKAVSRLVHTDIAVRMEDKPSQALRYGRWKSSMWLAIDAVKKGEADMAVSAGNTGALMAMSKFNLKTLPGIERPAIAALWPTLRGESIVLDVGASIGADAEHLVDLAVMGAATARILFGLPRPSVGLLNIGVEEAKGLEPVREAGRILREEGLPDLDYHGFVEGDDIGRGKVDVVVTEGFAGNIALKTAEGTARQLGEYLKGAMNSSLSARIGYLLRALRRSGNCASAWIRAGPMAASFSASTASSSKATAAPTPKVLPRPSNSATAWCETSCWRKSGPRWRPAASSAAEPVPQQGSRRSGLVTVQRSVMLGCGSYLPSQVLTNEDLARKIDTSDEWIVQRTGIHERRIAAPGEADLAYGRARGAGRAGACACRRAVDRSHRAGDLDAGQYLSRQRRFGAGRSRHHPRRRLRSAGGVLRLRLWPGDGRRAACAPARSRARW